MHAHLWVRSYYSLLNGTMSPKEIVDLAKKNAYQAIAITDQNLLFAALEFFNYAKKEGIKPIIGIEASMQEEERLFSSLILAKNNEGYKALIKISKLLQKQTLTWLDLRPYSQDLHIFAMNENGPFEEAMVRNQWGDVFSILHDIKAILPDIKIGLSHQESSFFKAFTPNLIKEAQKLNIEIIPTPKIYYKEKEDEKTLRLLNAIRDQVSIHDSSLVVQAKRHFLSQDELGDLYSEDMLARLEKMVASCNVDLSKLKTSLPDFKQDKQVSNDVYLQELSRFGLKRRLQRKPDQVYIERLEMELKVITSMSFTNYFLIVYDLIRFAKSQGIYVGPGRGSSAGSLVAYCLGITEVDPVAYDLMFERFLNPERISMPDIDIDFPDNRRQEVIDYVVELYGEDHVAHIPTFGTLKARQALRDVARVYQIPIHNVDKLTRMIPYNASLEQAEQNSRLKLLLDSDDKLAQIYQYAKAIEGLPRHASLHAAGIVLSKKPLDEVCPTMYMEEGILTLQFTMGQLETQGLIKIDFLGLRNLSLLDRISSDIRQKDESFNLTKISLDDKKTLALLDRGDTGGIFQLESAGMTKLLREVGCSQFSDIVDVIALYRPGPMENIPLYLEAKRQPDKMLYLHDDLKPITESSYGVLIYQEQIMQVAQKMAGFSLSKADILRYAMSKKDEKALATLHQDFIEGVIAKSYEVTFAEELYHLVYRFANYGFNKAHSVAYALIAYQLAYVKTHYPQLFYMHLLNSVIGSEGKTQAYLEETKRARVAVLPLHAEYSQAEYSLEGNAIRLPLTLIKGISFRTALLSHEEAEKGRFLSFFDAVSRLNAIKLNRSHLENLIKAGAFDYFKQSRLSLLASLEDALAYARVISIESKEGLILDRSLISEPIFTIVKADKNKTLTLEYEALGFYLSEHPLKSFREKNQTVPLHQIKVSANSYEFVAVINRYRTHKTKKGETMAFVDVSDEYASLSLVLFPRTYKGLDFTLQSGLFIRVRGTMKEEGNVIVDTINLIEKSA